jgi:hydroxymethylpyrimidine/phosphomethylpyrimidine kinase
MPGLKRLSRARTHVVCSIGSTDPTAAAGLFADAWVYGSIGVAAAYVVAGVTAQNSRKVFGVEAVAPDAIAAQLKAVLEQVRPDSIRIGLVPSARGIDCIAKLLARARLACPIVLDPVMTASSGHRFAGAREIAALRRLMPLVTIVTPNVPEAEALAGLRIRDGLGAERAALALAASGTAVLVTGGHLTGDRSVDVLASGGRVTRFSHVRVRKDMRGTGCALAAALAAHLALGADLETSVRRARAFVRRAILTAAPLGEGRPQLPAQPFAGVRASRA